MEYKITGCKPEKLFHFFEEISAIPRGSGNEKAISDYLVAYAKERGLWYYQDELFNVIIKKPGSKGAEEQKPVMLQGHIDMVCEKLEGVEHDFTKDGLNLLVEDGALKADGTTLGADNGIAVALMLMVMDDETLAHPPLECVFTSQEETGLFGAAGLDKSQISASTMINLDSEEEGIATVSCAGGLRIIASRKVEREEINGTQLQLSVSGLMGGHSGSDINKGRQNGNILMARLLYRLLEGTDGRVVSFVGGTKDNAIPRECKASLVYADSKEAENAKALAEELAEAFRDELAAYEKEFACNVTSQEAVVSALTREDSMTVVKAVYMAPNGVQKRNMTMEGFVVTSTNLGIVNLEENVMYINFSPRSSVVSLMEDLKLRIRLSMEEYGFDCEFSAEYPGWSYKEESAVREVFKDSYRDLFKDELKIEAIHAGLECGLFSDALPGIDAIAVGPTIQSCHTPDERLPLDSVERFYELLTDVLKRMANL